MTRPRLQPQLARLLALLLLLQWGTAFAHCLQPLAAAASEHSVDICGAEGFTTALLDNGGEPFEKPRASHAVRPGCCGPVALVGPAHAGVPRPVAWPGEGPVRSRGGLPVAPARAPPQHPRAPPTA